MKRYVKKKVIYEIKGLYRDDFRVTGYEFGKGKKSVCIVGAMRGNEVQQHANTSVFKLVKA